MRLIRGIPVPRINLRARINHANRGDSLGSATGDGHARRDANCRHIGISSIRLSGGNRIDVSFASDLNWTANFDGSANFRNGFDLDTGAGDPAFTGVTIVSNGGNAGFDASHVTVSAHHIAVDWAGLSFAAGQHVTLDLLFA